MTDCEDPECCAHPKCAGNSHCPVFPEPSSLLTPADKELTHLSLWQRARFLLSASPQPVQRYAQLPYFVPHLATVVRGRVVTARGRGLPGVGITFPKTSELGFTLSRTDGEFDFLLNAEHDLVVLHFGRSPYSLQEVKFRVRRGEV